MKLFNKIFCLVSLAVTVSACNNDQLSESPLDEYFAISKITINETKNSIDNENIILKKNSKVELSCIVTPDNASDKSVLWTSSDETVATVSIDGVVEAKNIEGSAVISVTPTIGFGATDAMTAVKVQVVDNYIDIRDFEITAEGGKTKIFMSETLQLTATVTNLDATFKRFTWKSSNDEIATVDPNTGLVTAVSEGDVVITATTDDFRSEPISKDFNIEIEKAILLKDLTFTDDSELSALGYGQTYEIPYTTDPSDATRTLISWESSNPDIAVDNGVIKVNTITEGSATITARTTKEDGTELVKTVNVSVAKGRFDFSFGNGLAPWYREASNPGVSDSNDGEKTTIVMKEIAGKGYRADLQFVKDKDSYLDASKYPILAMKIKLPTYNKSGNGPIGFITFELLQKNPDGLGGNYKGGNNNHLSLGTLVDGEIAYIYYDLTSKFGSKWTLSTTEPTRIDRLTFKIADFKNITDTSYDIYWVKSFSNVNELKSYVDSESEN